LTTSEMLYNLLYDTTTNLGSLYRFKKKEPTTS
jgi:hypothetical protein